MVQQSERQTVGKDFMRCFSIELVILVLNELSIKDTWRLQCVSKLWKDRLTSVDIVRAAWHRWHTQDAPDSSSRLDKTEPLGHGFRTFRQHQRRYPAVRIMDPIQLQSIEWPFHNEYTTTAEPLLAGDVALICLDDHEYRFEIVDLQTHQRWEVPLPTTYNSRQDQYRSKALGTNEAAFLRKDVCYLYNWRKNELRIIAFPSTKQNIHMLAVTIWLNEIYVVYSDGGKRWLLCIIPDNGIQYKPLPSCDGIVPMVTTAIRPRDDPICAAYVNEDSFMLFYIQCVDSKYNVCMLRWYLKTGATDGERSAAINADMHHFRTTGLLTVHSTGVKGQLRVKVAGGNSTRIGFYNILFHLSTANVLGFESIHCGGTYWKQAMLLSQGRKLAHRISAQSLAKASREVISKQPIITMDCFAMQEGASLFPKYRFGETQQQCVAINESYLVTCSWQKDSSAIYPSFVWNFFSWDDEDEGIPLVVGKNSIQEPSGEEKFDIVLAH